HGVSQRGAPRPFTGSRARRKILSTDARVCAAQAFPSPFLGFPFPRGSVVGVAAARNRILTGAQRGEPLSYLHTSAEYRAFRRPEARAANWEADCLESSGRGDRIAARTP